jgi:hypothetical protein
LTGRIAHETEAEAMATKNTESTKPKPEEIVVFLTRQNGKCAECGMDLHDGTMIRLENGQPHCLDCADLGHLEFLPSGNTALTRRATKHSPLRAVVLQWARSRKRYERQGILVTGEAVDRAEQECLADEGSRARQRERAAVRREGVEALHEAAVTAAIRTAFPGCPPGEAEGIAAWTCRKHSGRVGRSAGAKALDPAMLRLAVIARIRHEYTGYDRLLMQLGDRRMAREEVRAEIDRILAQWSAPVSPSAGT